MIKGDIFICKDLNCKAIVLTNFINSSNELECSSTLTCYGGGKIFTIHQVINFIYNEFNSIEEVVSLEFGKILTNAKINELNKLL